MKKMDDAIEGGERKGVDEGSGSVDNNCCSSFFSRPAKATFLVVLFFSCKSLRGAPYHIFFCLLPSRWCILFFFLQVIGGFLYFVLPDTSCFTTTTASATGTSGSREARGV